MTVARPSKREEIRRGPRAGSRPEGPIVPGGCPAEQRRWRKSPAAAAATAAPGRQRPAQARQRAAGSRGCGHAQRSGRVPEAGITPAWTTVRRPAAARLGGVQPAQQRPLTPPPAGRRGWRRPYAHHPRKVAQRQIHRMQARHQGSRRGGGPVVEQRHGEPGEGRVHRRDGFVGEQQLGLLVEHPGQRDPLQLAAGELVAAVRRGGRPGRAGQPRRAPSGSAGSTSEARILQQHTGRAVRPAPAGDDLLARAGSAP